MKLIAADELAANPPKVLDDLGREGSFVITENGHPRGILTPTSAETVLEDVDEFAPAHEEPSVKFVANHPSAAWTGLL